MPGFGNKDLVAGEHFDVGIEGVFGAVGEEDFDESVRVASALDGDVAVGHVGEAAGHGDDVDEAAASGDGDGTGMDDLSQDGDGLGCVLLDKDGDLGDA